MANPRTPDYQDISNGKNYFNLFDLLNDTIFEAQPDNFRQIIEKYWTKDQMLVDKLTIQSLKINQRLDLLLKETINITWIINSYDKNHIQKIKMIGLGTKAKLYTQHARIKNDYEEIISILYSDKIKLEKEYDNVITGINNFEKKLITREQGMQKVSVYVAPINWNLDKVKDAFEKLERTASKEFFYPLSEKFKKILQKYKVD